MANPILSHGNDASSGRSFLDRFQALVGIILTVVAGYSAWQLNAAEKSLKDSERGIKARESERKDSEEARVNRESLEKKQLTVYDAVVKSLESGDPKRQRVSKALVTSMLEDPLRTELLNVLTETGTPEIKKEVQVTLAQESTFKAQEVDISTKKVEESQKKGAVSSKWGNWDFDIFWCERSGNAAKEQAEKVRKALLDDGANGRLRVRLLPDSINARPGYQHTGYVIRYNEGEENQASQLAAFADKTIPTDTTFIQTISHQPTPWYLSVFVCPAHL